MPRRRNFRGKKRHRRGRRVRRGRGKKLSKIQTLVVRQPGAIMPDRLRVKLMFMDQTVSVIGSGGAALFASRRYRPTALYDVDPTLGGTTIAGFTALSSLYGYYRVHASSIKLWFSNLDTGTAICCVCLPLNNDPGAAPGIGIIQSWQMNPFTRQAFMSGQGGLDRCKVSNYVSVKKLVGTSAVKFDDSYAATVGSIPVNNVFWAFAVISEDGTTMTKGVSFQVRMTMYCEFYDRKELTN